MDKYNNLVVKQPTQPLNCPRCSVSTEPDKPFCVRCKLDLRYGSPGPATKGKCCYCNYEGELTREHLFGKWLQKRFPKPMETRFHKVSRPERLEFFVEVPIHSVEDDWRGSPYEVTTHNVCATCNSGWMSRLQSDAKPIVERFADGFWPRLTGEQCNILTRWACMVTVNLESYARITTVNQYQRDQLKRGQIPDGFRVSIGKMVGREHSGFHFHRTFKLPMGIGCCLTPVTGKDGIRWDQPGTREKRREIKRL